MALVAQSPTVAAMDGEQAVMHPFFAACRGRSREPATEDEAESAEVTQEQGLKETPDGPRKARTARKRSPEKKIQQSTLNFSYDGNIDSTSDLVSRENEPDSASKPSAQDHEESRLMEGPQKRQRTLSAERPATPPPVDNPQPLGWEEQLIQAAFGGPSPRDMGSKRSVEPTPPSLSTPDNLEPGPLLNTGTVSTEPKASSENQTPPKKIIKLRLDGRLISPKVKEQVVKRKAKRKSDGSPHESSKIVILRYGSDATSRASIAQQISEILSGVQRIKSADNDKKLRPINNKPSLPTKPTHPFFSGKVSRVKADTPLRPTPDDSDAATSGAEKSADSKTIAVPRKSWAGFGASFSKTPRALGTLQAIWPPRDMMHCRGHTSFKPDDYTASRLPAQRKLKAAQTILRADEDLLNLYQSSLRFEISHNSDNPASDKRFHRPSRRLLTGKQLRSIAQNNLTVEDPNNLRPATAKLLDEVNTSLSAFDRFECQTQEWVHKYAPKSVSDMLQDSDSLLLLRDWLQNLTVNAVNVSSGSAGTQATALARKLKARAKKKRKISEGLDDFVVSSEDELGMSDDITDPEDENSNDPATFPRLSQRNVRRAKAVVLSGPHGCGKTALVYAVAQELGFEVFEINAGTRRSGKDILDRVGDMTRNHLVRQLPDDEVPNPLEEDVSAPDAISEVASGRQSTMNSFFKASNSTKKPPRKTKKETSQPAEQPKKAPRKQKQSLILFEEVDVLFEEDKQFWSTVFSLLLSSRRPIIFTCTSAYMLPVEEMIDVVGLHLAPVSEDVAVDYLTLIAANEGHIISRLAMTRLFQIHGCDLRAAINQLNFLCQMALGDTKGGLEWMLIRSAGSESRDDNGEPIRVTSDSTFTADLTAVMRDLNDPETKSRCKIDEQLCLLQAVYAGWDLEPEEWIDVGIDHMCWSDTSPSLESLRKFEAATEALSAADILPGSRSLETIWAPLDPTQAPLTERERANYPEGLRLLDTPMRIDQTTLSQSLVLTLQLLTRPLRHLVATPEALTAESFSSLLAQRSPSLHDRTQAYANSLAVTLDPLTLASPTYLGVTSPSRLPAMASHVLATDVAPYVRGIVAADRKLEQVRLALSNLRSAGGGSAEQKTRTTRAARAALEGGRKEHTRRERWFRKEVNYRDVLATGLDEWATARDALEAAREDTRPDEEEEIQDELKMDTGQ